MTMEQDARMLIFHMPEDANIRAALGEVSVRHSQLDHILRMTVKTIAGLSIKEALDSTSYEGSSRLRKRILKLAAQRIGEGVPFLKLKALMTRCGRITLKRNAYVHGVYAKWLDGDTQISTDDGWATPPTVEELKRLADEIVSLIGEINEARLRGFLAHALESKR